MYVQASHLCCCRTPGEGTTSTDDFIVNTYQAHKLDMHVKSMVKAFQGVVAAPAGPKYPENLQQWELCVCAL